MILYGRNAVREALRGRRRQTIGPVWATHGAARESWLARVDVQSVSAEEVERRCGSTAHQGVCAQAGAYPYASAEELLRASAPLVVALDQIQDPQNLGSICRTCECVGVSGVVIPERRAAEVTPAVCKASAGAVEHLALARVRNVADFLGQARQAGCWCYGASVPADGEGASSGGGVSEGASSGGGVGEGASSGGGAGEGASSGGGTSSHGTTMSYDQPDYSGGVVLVLGSEGKGLRPRVAGACDALIALPLRGRIQSLGVSAAAAALLYEILQNRTRGLDKAP